MVELGVWQKSRTPPTNKQHKNRVWVIQGGADDKLFVENWLEEVAGVEPEGFLPPIADIVVPQVISEHHGQDRHQAGHHPAQVQQPLPYPLFSYSQAITWVADHQKSVEDDQDGNNPETKLLSMKIEGWRGAEKKMTNVNEKAWGSLLYTL